MKKRTFRVLLCLGLFAMTLTSCGNTNPYADDPRYPIFQLAVDSGFTGTYEEWLESIKGEDGQDGETPYIGENGNWWIGDADTGVPARGPEGPEGPAGSDGEPGSQGEPGKDGTSMHTGHGAPSSDLGQVGDSYVDLDTWDFYVKYENGWVLEGNIKGSDATSTPDHEGTEGLEFYPLNDKECAVSVGAAKFLKNIVIPSTYKYFKVTEILERGFENSRVETIIIPDSVTSIGDYTFRGCSSLTSITIPDSVTSIGYYAFSGCSSLSNVYHKGTIEDWCNIPFYSYESNPMYCADHFYMLNESNDWYEVTEIVIPDTVTIIGNNQFYNFKNITTLSIGNSVTTIGGSAFSGCSSLASIIIPDSVTTICSDAFSYCSSLASIVIPDSVTYIFGPGFRNCFSLTIYCEATSEPTGWLSNWNYDNRPVYWGGQWEFDNNNNPTPSVPDAVHTISIDNKTDLAADWLVGGTVRILDLTLTADGEEVNALQALINGELTFEYTTAGVVSNTGLQLDAVALGTTTLTITYFEVSDTVTFNVVEPLAEPAIVEGLTCAEIASQGKTAKNTVLYRARGTLKDFATKPGPNEYGEFTLTDGTGDVYFYGSYVNTTEEPASFVWNGESYDRNYTARNFLTADMTKDIKVGDEIEIIAMHAESYDNFYGIFVSVTPCAPIPATAVTLNKTELTLDLGASETLVATITPADCNEPVTWTSDDKTVATVDNIGKVSAVGAGTANVTVTVGTVSATCVVTVNAPTTPWVILTSATLGLGAYADGTATIKDVEFSYVQLGDYGNGIQMRSKNGKTSSLWNTTAISDTIDSVDFVYTASQANYSNENALKVEFSASADFSNAETQYISTVEGQTTPYTLTPTITGAVYMRITHNMSTSAYWTSITINC